MPAGRRDILRKCRGETGPPIPLPPRLPLFFFLPPRYFFHSLKTGAVVEGIQTGREPFSLFSLSLLLFLFLFPSPFFLLSVKKYRAQRTVECLLRECPPLFLFFFFWSSSQRKLLEYPGFPGVPRYPLLPPSLFLPRRLSRVEYRTRRNPGYQCPPPRVFFSFFSIHNLPGRRGKSIAWAFFPVSPLP